MADKQGIDILFENSELSESAKDEIKVMFEAAVSEAVSKKKEELEENHKAKLEEAIEAAIPEIEKTVDEAITYVAESWMNENKLAVDSGIRSELVESFLSGMKELFSEHYVDIPEDKVDVVEEMAEIVQEKDGQLDSAISENLVLKNEIKGMKKDKIISSVTEGMVETDIERFKTLVEDVEFIDEDSFKSKATIIKNKYFSEETMDKEDDEEEMKDEKYKSKKKDMKENYGYADFMSRRSIYS